MSTVPRFPFIYYGLCCVAYCLAAPFLLLLTLKSKYRHSIPARFFPTRFRFDFSPKYWFHACSLGESKSYEPILDALLTQEKHSQILLTCTTSTGFQYLQTLTDRYPKQLSVAYLPFEIFLPLYLPYLKSLQTLVVTEAELWKMLFWVAKKVQAQTLLVNARISDSSLKNYMRLRFFYRSLFTLIDYVLAQLPSDQERLQALGAKNIEVFGNLKVFSTPKITRYFQKSSPIILAASTHPDEEKLIFESFVASNAQAKLIIAPRHPERFHQVHTLLHSLCAMHSLGFSTLEEEWSDVVLVNKLGELNNLYAIADCVILCGSFVPIGGHNPLEPAFFQAPIITGKHIFNQKALFALVENAQIISPQELTQMLSAFDTLPHTNIKTSSIPMHDLISLIQRKTICKKPTNS